MTIDGVTIGKITEGIQFDDFGHVLRVKQITYRIDGNGPFTLSVAPDQFTDAAVSALLMAERDKVRAVMGAPGAA